MGDDAPLAAGPRPESVTPVLEIGGTHVTAALVGTDSWTVDGEPIRSQLDADGSADEILGTLVSVASALPVPPGASWAVAIPDPFDYAGGIGRFAGVAKFEALNGVSVRDELLKRLPSAPASIVFLNDADAFALGEWAHGAAVGAERMLGLTLGTGVGSGWVSQGRIVVPQSPPGGRAHLLTAGTGLLEETMSRRAIRRAYQQATGDAAADVVDIAARARRNDTAASAVLMAALGGLGAALAAPIHAFEPEVIVVGGSMARSWDLFGPWFEAGADLASMAFAPVVREASDHDASPLIGAAWFAGS